MKFACRYLLLCILLVSYHVGIGQLSNIDRDIRLENLIDRVDIKHGLPHFYHPSIKYDNRLRTYDLLIDMRDSLTGIDSFESNLWIEDFSELITESRLNDQALEDPPQKKKWFYRDKAHLWTLNHPDINLALDPILGMSIGREFPYSEPIVQNTRGLRLRGKIDNKIYFHTDILETQRSFQRFINENIEENKAVPGQGFYRNYQSSIWKQWKGYDYLNSRGHLGFKLSKSIDLQLGHGRHFIGHGMRSLLLSDFGHNYFYARLTTNVWKFQYQNIFAELSSISGKSSSGNVLIPKKYMAAHFLDFNITKNFSIGFYEAVVFSRANRFELQYLNPVILYRSVELMLDSPDNILIGLNGRLNFKKSLQLYAQIMLDEFKLTEVVSDRGWWANKIAYQAGIKYPDAFEIPYYDIQLEYNRVRPFTFTHRTTDGAHFIPSYSHYNQALAHPLGAKFYEFILRQSFRINSQWSSTIDFYYIAHDEGEGHNILSDYQTRSRDFGYNLLEDRVVNRIFIDASMNYRIRPGYTFELRFRHLNTRSYQPENTASNLFSLGIFVNLWQDPLVF